MLLSRSMFCRFRIVWKAGSSSALGFIILLLMKFNIFGNVEIVDNQSEGNSFGSLRLSTTFFGSGLTSAFTSTFGASTSLTGSGFATSWLLVSEAWVVSPWWSSCSYWSALTSSSTFWILENLTNFSTDLKATLVSPVTALWYTILSILYEETGPIICLPSL